MVVEELLTESRSTSAGSRSLDVKRSIKENVRELQTGVQILLFKFVENSIPTSVGMPAKNLINAWAIHAPPLFLFLSLSLSCAPDTIIIVQLSTCPFVHPWKVSPEATQSEWKKVALFTFRASTLQKKSITTASNGIISKH